MMVRTKEGKRLERRLLHKVGKAIQKYDLIHAGDKILVAVSGGKDSWSLLHILYALHGKAPISFDLYPVIVDCGFEGMCYREGVAYVEKHMAGLSCTVWKTGIARILERYRNRKKSICAFCSRLRRGVLYSIAQREGYNKIALAHHADDFIETLLMNQFFNGSLKAMAPILHADDGHNVVIRPLCFVEERDIASFAKEVSFPIVQQTCSAEKGADETKMQRRKVKNLVLSLEKQGKGIKASLLASMSRIEARHLMDIRYGSGR